MAGNVSDEAFARAAQQGGVVSYDDLEAARAVQAERAKKGVIVALADVLIQKGVITAKVRENIEKKALAQEAGGLMQLGPYKLTKKLGEGGMGAVYLAEDTSVGRKVAVKVLPKKYSEEREFLTRFRREAQATGKLNHVNIVMAYNVGEEAGTHYYAMEYCDGETLDRILKREQYLTWDKAIAVTIQVARGLKHAHDHAIIHRDIKPANIFICSPLSPVGRGPGERSETGVRGRDEPAAAPLSPGGRGQGEGASVPADDVTLTLSPAKHGQDACATGSTGVPPVPRENTGVPPVPRENTGETPVLQEGFVAKILDLGLSKNIASTEQSFLTQTGAALGTPHYISPEQARGDKNIDGRTDIYSLGATLYHLVTGQTPYSGTSAGVVIAKHLSERLPNPQDINADIPDGVVQVIQKMMAKQAADRYANCAELLADLELASQGKQPSSVNLDPALTTIATRQKGPQAKGASKPRAARPATTLVRKKTEPVPLEPLEPVDETLVRKDAARAESEPRPLGSGPLAYARGSETAGGRRGLGRKHYLAAGVAALVLLVVAAALALRAKPQTQNPKSEGSSRTPTTATGKTDAKLETTNLKPEAKVWLLHDGKEPIADYAKRVGLPATQELDLGQGMKLELVLIPAGKFTMGSPETEKDRDKSETQHEVTITKPFYMGKYEVTQALYEALIGKNPSNLKGAKNPVDNVSWDDAQEFCTKISAKTGKTVSLPTEAQWEFACRAGTTAPFYLGDAEADLDAMGWWRNNSGQTTHPVGEKKPNAWGLYDMLGNAWEWCEDWCGEYSIGAATDPKGAGTGTLRVLRGGSWSNWPNFCRAAQRLWIPPLARDSYYGFRVVVAGPPPASQSAVTPPAAQPETANLKPGTKVWPLHDGKEPVADYAKRVGVPATVTLDLGGGVKMELVLVPAGEFDMGSNDGADEETPVHKVKISQPFYITKHETTVAQFRAFADATEFQTDAEKQNKGWTVKDGMWQGVAGANWRSPGFKQEDNHPVCLLSWVEGHLRFLRLHAVADPTCAAVPAAPPPRLAYCDGEVPSVV